MLDGRLHYVRTRLDQGIKENLQAFLLLPLLSCAILVSTQFGLADHISGSHIQLLSRREASRGSKQVSLTWMPSVLEVTRTSKLAVVSATLLLYCLSIALRAVEGCTIPSDIVGRVVMKDEESKDGV